MFSESQQGAACSFKEPPEHGGKFRWQIIHLKEKHTTKKLEATGDEDVSGSQEVLVPKEKGESLIIRAACYLSVKSFLKHGLTHHQDLIKFALT